MSRRCIGLVSAFLAMLGSPLARAAGTPIASNRVAVFDVVGRDVDKDVLAQLSEMIGGEVASHAGYEVIAVSDVRREAAADEAQPRSCTRNDACIDQVAHTLHANMVVTGSVARAGTEYELRLELGRSGELTDSTQTFATVKQLKSLPDTLLPCLETLFRWSDDEAPVTPVAPAHLPSGGDAARFGPPAPTPAAAPPDQIHRVMVLDLRAIGLDPRSIAPMTELLAQEVALHAGYEVASADDVLRLLSAQTQKLARGCDEDEACLKEISHKLAADFVVTGSVSLSSQGYVLNLALIDTNAIGQDKGSSETVGNLDDLAGAVVPGLARLFHWKDSGPGATAFHLPKGKNLNFAVLDLKPAGLADDLVRHLTHVLSVEAKEAEGVSVVSHDEMAAMIQGSAKKLDLGCENDPCRAEIGGLLGVDRMVTGDVSKVGGTYIITLRLVDARTGRVENRVNESFRGDEGELARAVRHAGRGLLGLNVTGSGRLAITASQNAAAVYVDDVLRGRAPLPVNDVPIGAHGIRVSQPGFFDWQGDVYVDPWETTAVWAQLSARPEAWYQKWWVWTIAGAVVAGVTVTSAVVGTRPHPAAGHDSLVGAQ